MCMGHGEVNAYKHRCSQEPKEGARSSGARVMSGSEPPDVGAGI